MKIRLLVPTICFLTIAAIAANHPDFSGSWQLNTSKSKNIGMMANMNMTQNIKQSDLALDVTTHTTFQGNDQDSKTHYDLSGNGVENEAPMEGPSQTVSKWRNDQLVTTWTSQSAVAGKKVVREETRSLSADGKTMTIESARGSNPAVVLVFDKAQ